VTRREVGNGLLFFSGGAFLWQATHNLWLLASAVCFLIWLGGRE
jgi:hypothetical protein